MNNTDRILSSTPLTSPPLAQFPQIQVIKYTAPSQVVPLHGELKGRCVVVAMQNGWFPERFGRNLDNYKREIDKVFQLGVHSIIFLVPNAETATTTWRSLQGDPRVKAYSLHDLSDTEKLGLNIPLNTFFLSYKTFIVNKFRIEFIDETATIVSRSPSFVPLTAYLLANQLENLNFIR